MLVYLHVLHLLHQRNLGFSLRLAAQNICFSGKVDIDWNQPLWCAEKRLCHFFYPVLSVNLVFLGKHAKVEAGSPGNASFGRVMLPLRGCGAGGAAGSGAGRRLWNAKQWVFEGASGQGS